MLRGENVGYGEPDWSEKQCLDKDRAEQFPNYKLDAGDVVIGMDRTFTRSGVKITVLSSSDCPALLVQRVGKFVAKSCEPLFLRWLVESPHYLRELLKQEKGMDIPHLSKTEILAPKIAIPPRLEQVMIALRADVIPLTIGTEIARLSKLRQFKHGLMHDLLTGRVRVQAG